MRLGGENKYIGIQVAAYRNGRLVLDECVYMGGAHVLRLAWDVTQLWHASVCTGAGVMGATDPRPVMPDTLFNCFSVTKAIAGMPP
jgi:CubicO group peptidase (beta-lactamase class C family)